MPTQGEGFSPPSHRSGRDRWRGPQRRPGRAGTSCPQGAVIRLTFYICFDMQERERPTHSRRLPPSFLSGTDFSSDFGFQLFRSAAKHQRASDRDRRSLLVRRTSEPGAAGDVGSGVRAARWVDAPVIRSGLAQASTSVEVVVRMLQADGRARCGPPSARRWSVGPDR
jgi:hypothetical protein